MEGISPGDPPGVTGHGALNRGTRAHSRRLHVKLSIAFAARFGLVLCWLVGTAAAVPPPGPPSPSTWPTLTDQAIDGPRRFVTKHQGAFGDKVVNYQASVAETIVKSPEGTPAASAFTLAFTALG